MSNMTLIINNELMNHMSFRLEIFNIEYILNVPKALSKGRIIKRFACAYFVIKLKKNIAIHI